MKFVYLLLSLFGFVLQLNAQFNYYLQAFSFPVFENNIAVAQPFTGGFNAVNVSKTDINLDGIKDLMLFDKTDEKMHALLGNANNTYMYAPEYTKQFPSLKVFGLFKDYNNDGIDDLYTVVNANSGFSVLKSKIVNNKRLFNLKTSNGLPFLMGDYNPPSPPSSYVNIVIGGDQIPGIYDIDNDGDLDVFHYSTINFFSFLQAYKNVSVESFGVADSLNFARVDACYGKFKENICAAYTLYPNSITPLALDSICKLTNYIGFKSNSNDLYKTQNLDPNTSLMLFDQNHDGQADILMADYSCDSIRFLKGSNINGYNVMQSVTSQFPNTLNPIKMQSPTAYYEDIDNDGLKDLVFSTNNVNTIAKQSIWYYKNTAANASAPDTYSLISKGLIQDQTIDVGFQSHPVLFDIDSDGDNDLFIGSGSDFNYITGVATSSIYFYKNIGTANAPQFTLITNDFLNLQSFSLKSLRPAFGDLDNDGDPDLVVGAFNGKFYYFDNTSGISPGTIPSYTFVANKFPSTYDVGDYASPTIIDANNDGFNDIISGGFSGKLNLIKQSSLNNFTFIKPWGGIVVCPFTNCNVITVPAVLKFNNKKYLAVGLSNGKVLLYNDLGLVTNDTLVQIDTNLLHFNPYFIKSSLGIGDLNGDAKPDFIIGNARGGIYAFLGDTNNLLSIANENRLNRGELFPNPANNQVVITNSNQNDQVKIMDALGKEMTLSNKPILKDGQLVCNISNLNPGFYYLYVVKSATYKVAFRFIKE